MQCVIKSENVQGVDLIAFVKGNRTAQGEQRHVSFRLHGAAFADDPVADDFSLGDMTPLADDEPIPTAVLLSPDAKKTRAWRKERNPGLSVTAAMRLAGTSQPSGPMAATVQNLLTYTGPSKMLRQYTCVSGRPSVPMNRAWQYVAQLYGGDYVERRAKETMTRQPCGNCTWLCRMCRQTMTRLALKRMVVAALGWLSALPVGQSNQVATDAHIGAASC